MEIKKQSRDNAFENILLGNAQISRQTLRATKCATTTTIAIPTTTATCGQKQTTTTKTTATVIDM